MTNAEVLSQVEHGYRMPMPPNSTPALYEIMLECWHKVNSKYFLKYFKILTFLLISKGSNATTDFRDTAMET